MEPIRPDDDELIADEPFGAAEPREAAPGKQKPVKADKPKQKAEKPPKPPKPPRQGKTGGAGGGSGLVWFLLLVVAAGAGAGWYFQEQRIQALEVQLEEADYWARQSKLALARFEGELSETGESLQERGASLEEQLAANKKQIDAADSEIRKLWVIANERNKKRLDEHQQRLASIDDKLAAAERAVAGVDEKLGQVQAGLASDVTALETRVAELAEAGEALQGELAEVSGQVAGVDELVDSRIRRFQQEQRLTLDGIESRIAALEKAADSSAGDAEVGALRNELSQLKRTVEAIDASRSQLTSRLVRLSEEVNQLRAQ
jgi:chromosome segregation ATPase